MHLALPHVSAVVDYWRTARSNATGASVVAERHGHSEIVPFDGRHDVVDPWRDDFIALITVCQCQRGRRRKLEMAESVRAEVRAAVERMSSGAGPSTKPFVR